MKKIKNISITVILLSTLSISNSSADDTYAVIGKNAFDGIKAKLLSNLKPSNYTNLKVNINRFRQEPNIFAKYSYDETVLQFLRPPFEYFAIELTASFITTCATEININPNNC